MDGAEVIRICEALWILHNKEALAIACEVMKRNPLPPIAGALPGLPKFLADLQRASFCHGVQAALNVAEAIQ